MVHANARSFLANDGADFCERLHLGPKYLIVSRSITSLYITTGLKFNLGIGTETEGRVDDPSHLHDAVTILVNHKYTA